MGWFNHNLKREFKNSTDSIMQDILKQYYAGYNYGHQEYAGSWESKNWKDELEIMAKKLPTYDRMKFLEDAKNFGVFIGKLDAMLKSNLRYMIINDDKAAGILIEIIDGLKKIENFNLKELKVRVEALKKRKLTPEGQQNKKRLLDALKT